MFKQRLIEFLKDILCKRKKPIDNIFSKEKHHFPYKTVVSSVIAKQYKIDNHPRDLEIYYNIGHTNYRITAIFIALKKLFNLKWSDFIIDSWFRSLKLNKLLIKLGFGASSTSDHKKGKAIDFYIRNQKVSPQEICEFINKNFYAYNQLIQYDIKKFVHISFDSSSYLEKNEFLIKTKTGYKRVEN